MAMRYPMLCRTTTATSGTNPYVLSLTANLTAHRTPKQAVSDGSLADGDNVLYVCRNPTVLGDASFEFGEGTYNDTTNEISRSATNVFDGANGPGVLVSWPGSGTRDIYIIGSAGEKQARVDKSNTFTEDQEIKKTGVVLFDVESSNDSSVQIRLNSSAASQKRIVGLDGTTVQSQIILNSNEVRLSGATTSGDDIAKFGTSEVDINPESSDLDFRVRGDTDAQLLFSNAGKDEVGIGTSDPFGKLHVKTGDTSLAEGAINSAGDDIIVESNADAGITIIGGNTSSCSIFFADDDNAQVGRIHYDHGTNALQFTASNTNSFRADSNGIMIGSSVRTSSELQIRFTTGGKDLEFTEAGRTGATEQDWIEVEVDGNVGYIRVFSAK